jgi:transcriptional regulator with XRE-family HTH domain
MLRRDDELSRTAVARRAKLTVSDVAAIERGENIPLYKLDRLGWAFGFDPRTIIALADVETRAAGLRPSNKPSRQKREATKRSLLIAQREKAAMQIESPRVSAKAAD